jgi:hypothetical protein
MTNTLSADFAFAKASGEFSNAADLLRYVAAINLSATREQFVEASVLAGFKANTSANRFRESRKFDAETNSCEGV